MADLDLTQNQAAGILGNLGYESGGFIKLHEIGQPEGTGGYGAAQWTADRRRTFLTYAEAQGLDWRSDEANYGYILVELRGPFAYMVDKLRECATVEQAVWLVGQEYERPYGTTSTHLPAYDDRLDYARRAIAGAVAFDPNLLGGRPVSAAISPILSALPDPAKRLMQEALKARGLYRLRIDGVWGPGSQDAYDRFAAS